MPKIKKDSTYNINRFNYFKDKTSIWLMGYYENIKGYTENNTSLSNLHNLIDNWPIRKNEMIKILK